MNEKIKQLVEKAPYTTISTEGRLFSQQDLAKFAELIVEETLQVARAGIEYGPSMDEVVYGYFGMLNEREDQTTTRICLPMNNDEIDERIKSLKEMCDKLKEIPSVEEKLKDSIDTFTFDTSMIQPLTASQISTITISGGGGGGGSMASGGGTTYYTGGTGYNPSPITTTMPGIGHTMPGGAGTYYTSGPGGPTWTGTTTSTPANLKITGKNPTLSTEKSEINIDELADLISILKERLLILIPNFEKQEKYQALKKAYDHYKMIEALIQEEKIDVPK